MSDFKTNDTTSWPDDLVGLLERQHDMLGRLGELSTRQSSLIEARNTDALLGLLAQRQQIVDEFVSSQDELATLSTDLETRVATLPTERRDRIRGLLAEISGGLGDLMERDRHDQDQLQDACRQTSEDLGSIGTVRAARTAYLRGGPDSNRFADRRG